MKAKLFHVSAIVLVLVTLAACAAPAAAPPTPTLAPPDDPVSVIKALVDALNAGDVEAAVAFYADDALRTQQPPPAGQSGVWTGKEQVRGFVKGLVTDHFKVELSNLKAAGDKITYTCTFSTDTYRKLGVAPLVVVEEALFERGKIKSQTVTVTPESVAKIQAAMAAAQAKAATPTPAPPSATAIKPIQIPQANAAAIQTMTADAKTKAPRVLPEGTLRVGNLDRTYLYYVPANLPRNAPLLFVFHGWVYDAELMRAFTGYEFESLAEKNGFIVVYPNGYQRSWNECRKDSPLAAKVENIDDEGFVHALIARFRADYGIDPTRVFATGHSSGGQLAFRLAFHLPDEITAIAPVAASLPTDDTFDCHASGKPVAALIINGTADSFNPYDGGLVTSFGPQYRIPIRSSQASAEYFAKLNGQTSPPKTTRLPHQNPSDSTSVDRTVWNDAGKPEVVLVTINGGGHLLPQSKYPWPSAYGQTTSDVDGPAEIWDFFSRQRPLK